MLLRKQSFVGILTLWMGLGFSETGRTAEPPYCLKNFPQPSRNDMDEPLAKEFSLEKAGRFLDAASLAWHSGNHCCACHTIPPYLFARPLISADDPAPREIRQALEDYVAKHIAEVGQGKGGSYVTAAAISMAMNDAVTTKKLHPLTKKALAQLWTVQQKDGAFPWGGGPAPLGEVHFGVMIVSIAVGSAPEAYAKTEEARKGLARIRMWLEKHPPENLHQKIMLLWASSCNDRFLTLEERTKFIVEVRAKQLANGGWSLPSFGDWKLRPGPQLDPTVPDGYATGLCVLALRKAGVALDDPVIKRGVAWLKSNQRESGRWFTRSLYRDGFHYITHAGSAFAVMALHACQDALPTKSSRTSKP